MAPWPFKLQPLSTSALDLTPFSRPQEQEHSSFANARFAQAPPSPSNRLSPAPLTCFPSSPSFAGLLSTLDQALTSLCSVCPHTHLPYRRSAPRGPCSLSGPSPPRCWLNELMTLFCVQHLLQTNWPFAKIWYKSRGHIVAPCRKQPKCPSTIELINKLWQTHN